MQLPGDALQEVVDALQDAGINATTEPKKLQLPGALVIPGTLEFDLLDSENYSFNIDIYLLTSEKGSVHSMNDLQALLNKARTKYSFPNAEPISLTLPNIGGPDPVPGLLIALQATITEE